MKKIYLLHILLLVACNGFTSAQTPCSSAGLPVNLQLGLVGYYPFCGDADDQSGNLYNGTVYGATLTNDRFGNGNSAYHFDGVSNYIQLGSNFDLLPRTIVFWYNASLIDFNQRFVYVSDNNQLVNGLTNFGVVISASNQCWWSTISNITRYAAVTPNEWHQGVIEVDSTYTKKYSDGVLDYTDSLSSFSASGGGINAALVGSNRFANSEFFNGDIDDIMIFNRVLTTVEIGQLTSVQEPNNAATTLDVFPNPFSDDLNFTTSNNELSEIVLFDISSRKVYQQRFTNSVSLNTEQLAKGLYLYEVRDKNGLCKKGKVVKD